MSELTVAAETTGAIYAWQDEPDETGLYPTGDQPGRFAVAVALWRRRGLIPQ